MDDEEEANQNVLTWKVICKVTYVVTAKDKEEARMVVDEYNLHRIDIIKMDIVEVKKSLR